MPSVDKSADAATQVRRCRWIHAAPATDRNERGFQPELRTQVDRLTRRLAPGAVILYHRPLPHLCARRCGASCCRASCCGNSWVRGSLGGAGWASRYGSEGVGESASTPRCGHPARGLGSVARGRACGRPWEARVCLRPQRGLCASEHSYFIGFSSITSADVRLQLAAWCLLTVFVHAGRRGDGGVVGGTCRWMLPGQGWRVAGIVSGGSPCP